MDDPQRHAERRHDPSRRRKRRLRRPSPRERRALLVYATRHGSTKEVADAVAEELRTTFAEVEVSEARSAPSPAGYDAVVLGGPMIMGWHKDAKRYLKRHRDRLGDVPFALFVTAASLTEDGVDAVQGMPIAKDPWLVKKPRNVDKLSRKERYALPRHYVGDILKVCAPARPRAVALFAGSLDMTTMNVFEKLFVLLCRRHARRRPPLRVHPHVGHGARRRAARILTGRRKRTQPSCALVGDGTTLYAVASESLTSRQLATALQAQFSVTRAAPDGLIEGHVVVPNDPDRSKQRALLQVYAYSAWDITQGDPDVVVAVLDTGANVNHPDFAANVWTNAAESAGVAGEDDDGNGYVDDVYGIDALNHDVDPDPETFHGLHVASIIGAVPDNAIGVAGIGWSTKVMNLKCLGGADNIGTNASALECVDYVLDQKLNRGVNIVAINTSWGGGSYPYDPFMQDAVDAAAEAGIVWIASAGNDAVDLDQSPRYPASYDSPSILTVGATIWYNIAQYYADPEDDTGRATDDLALWSNYGETTVDLGAPGRDIYSASNGDTYGWVSGTSQAAPHVSAAVALCAAEYPAETALERVDRILTGVGPHASLDDLVASGGVLRIDQALTVTEDAMKPTTQIGGVDDAWHTSVGATFSGDDGRGIGVDFTQFKLDDGAWTTGAGLTVASHGTHTLQARSVDKAGHVGDAVSATVKIDTVKPTAQATGAGDAWHASPVEVTLTGDDADSGLDTLQYRLGTSGAWTAVASGGKVTVSDEGETTVQYRAVDVVGNASDAKSFLVKIDQTPPTISATGPSVWRRKAVEVTLDGGRRRQRRRQDRVPPRHKWRLDDRDERRQGHRLRRGRDDRTAPCLRPCRQRHRRQGAGRQDRQHTAGRQGSLLLGEAPHQGPVALRGAGQGAELRQGDRDQDHHPQSQGQDARRRTVPRSR